VYIQWDERLPDAIKVALPSGNVIELIRDHGWYSPHPVDGLDSADVLTNGLGLLGDGHRFEVRADEVYALAYDDDLGAWTSVDSISYGDRYHLIVRRDVLSEVLSFATAESTLTPQVKEFASKALPGGWVLVADVRIDARPKTAPPNSLAALVPAGSGPRLRLLGGLPLTAAHGVYLRGGEPAVALSTLTEEDQISITRLSTGQVERLRAAAANREVPLWHLRLEPDRYEIRHGDSSVSLQIVDGIAEAAGPGAGTVRHRAGGNTEVSGTSTHPSTEARRPLLVPAPAPGDSAVLLGVRPAELHRVELPMWLAHRLGFEPSWKNIDAWPEFEPVWLLLRGASRRLEAWPLARVEPVVSDDAASSSWGRLIDVSRLSAWASDEEAALWDRYRAAAAGQP
jgi:hypothetical protein